MIGWTSTYHQDLRIIQEIIRDKYFRTNSNILIKMKQNNNHRPKKQQPISYIITTTHLSIYFKGKNKTLRSNEEKKDIDIKSNLLVYNPWEKKQKKKLSNRSNKEAKNPPKEGGREI
jgi:hypothetical protein